MSKREAKHTWMCRLCRSPFVCEFLFGGVSISDISSKDPSPNLTFKVYTLLPSPSRVYIKCILRCCGQGRSGGGLVLVLVAGGVVYCVVYENKV